MFELESRGEITRKLGNGNDTEKLDLLPRAKYVEESNEILTVFKEGHKISFSQP